jgi:hypothetical protein
MTRRRFDRFVIKTGAPGARSRMSGLTVLLANDQLLQLRAGGEEERYLLLRGTKGEAAQAQAPALPGVAMHVPGAARPATAQRHAPGREGGDRGLLQCLNGRQSWALARQPGRAGRCNGGRRGSAVARSLSLSVGEMATRVPRSGPGEMAARAYVARLETLLGNQILGHDTQRGIRPQNEMCEI